MREHQPQPEQKETEPEIDFVEIFNSKLENIKPIADNQQSSEAWEFKEVNIKKVKRKACAIIFTIKGKENYNLWIEDIATINRDIYLHDEVNKRLEIFLKQNNLKKESYYLSSFIVQDDKNKRYLLTSGAIADHIQRDVKGEYWEKVWIKLCQKYNFDKILGQFNERLLPNGKKIFYGFTGTQEVLNLELVGKRRENIFLSNITKQHNMTMTEYLRFLVAIKTKKPAQTYDEVAEKIIAIDKTPDPTRKPDSEPLAE